METKTAFQWLIALLIGVGVVTVGFRFAAWLLTSFFILNCLVLIIVVLLQSGKAADLAGAFGGAGSQTAFGPRGAANVLSKATTWCAVMFMLCAMAMVLRTDKAVGGNSILERVSKPAPKPAPATTPAAPATTPGTAPANTPSTTPATTPTSTPASPSTTPSTTPAPASPQPNTQHASPPSAASQPAPAPPKKP